MNNRQRALLKTALRVVHEGEHKRIDFRDLDELVRKDFKDNDHRLRDFAIDIITDAIARTGEFAE
jgi:hypothetical protein